MTVDDATQMIEAARPTGVRLYVAENQVYETFVEHLAKIVRTGEHIGELLRRRDRWPLAPDPRYPGRRAGLTFPEQGGTGTWMLQGAHTVAQLRFVLGEVATVFMRDHRTSLFTRADLEATMSGVLVLERGVVVSPVQTTETELPPGLRGFRLHGDSESVIADLDRYAVYRNGIDDGRPTVLQYPLATLSSFARELQAFADYVAGRAVGPTTGESERRHRIRAQRATGLSVRPIP